MWGEATDKAGKWWISVGPNLRKVAWACHINKKRKRGVQIKSFRVGVGGKLEGGEYSHWSVCTFVCVCAVQCSLPMCVCVCVLRWGGRWSMFSKWISDEGLSERRINLGGNGPAVNWVWSNKERRGGWLAANISRAVKKRDEEKIFERSLVINDGQSGGKMSWSFN